jgi:hypothetical protein
MRMGTKFDLEQEVWGISNSNYGDYVSECSICDCTGKVKIKGEELICPKCNGQYVAPRWSVCMRGKVVRIETNRTINRLSSAWDNRNSYWLNTVGDGLIWQEERLFSSSKEAEDECGRRNRLLEGNGV